MGFPSRREPDGDGVAIVAAGVTTCRGAEESSVQDEGRQGNRYNLMRLREMRRGQRARSGNWRADYLETRTVGSPGGRMKKGHESGTSSAAYPTWNIRSKNDGLSFPDHAFPLARNSMEGQWERVLLAG